MTSVPPSRPPDRSPGGRIRTTWAWVLVAGASVAGPAAGQDVELLGRIYGTRPPAAYYERLSEPGAFEFARGVRRAPEAGPLEGVNPGLLRRSETPLGPRPGVVQGTFRFPLVLGLFSDTQGLGPYAPDDIQRSFFDGPNPTGTIPDLYREMSGGLVELGGATFPWQRSTLSAAQVAGGSSGLGAGARVGAFIVELLAGLDSTGVDWGAFDSDGPDGIPNSGDDDGFVDVLTVMHPTVGAECAGSLNSGLVWSHRWTLAAQGGGPFATSTPSAAGGVIRIDDYTIQPALSCDGVSLNEIGVFAHELGHGFGLPDLYATGLASHQGIGQWGLMGSGSWGCPGPFNPARPCHMSAWSKVALGWITPTRIASDAELLGVELPPVETSRQVLELQAGDGSGEVLLLENRQPIGFDDNMDGGGLLIWRVDPDELALRWAINTVNADVNRLGVALVQADGRGDLGRSNAGRGDPADPFPGITGARAFHAGTAPAARSGTGTALGITLQDITEASGVLRFDLWTRYQTLTVEATGTMGAAGMVAVDGTTAPSGRFTVRSAPFEEHRIVAADGVSRGPGARTPFQGWEDGSNAQRTFVTGLSDSVLVARYGGLEYEVEVALTSAQPGVSPATIVVAPGSPDGWVEAGAEIRVEARPRTGFRFEGWGGDLAGAPNPAFVTADGPIRAEASFEITMAAALGAPARVAAATAAELPLSVTEATAPVRWRLSQGALPNGLTLEAGGALVGAAMEVGTFPLEVTATDALGLEAGLAFDLIVTRPTLDAATLSAPFLGTEGGPNALERDFLDRNGNRNGTYDLGDFRAWLLAEEANAASASPRDPRPRGQGTASGGAP